MTKDTKKELTNMNEKELVDYLAEILNTSTIEFFQFEKSKEKETDVFEYTMRSSQGWKIYHEDKWEN